MKFETVGGGGREGWSVGMGDGEPINFDGVSCRVKDSYTTILINFDGGRVVGGDGRHGRVSSRAKGQGSDPFSEMEWETFFGVRLFST